MNAIENIYLEMYKSYFSTCNVFVVIYIVKFFKNLCVSEVYNKKTKTTQSFYLQKVLN